MKRLSVLVLGIVLATAVVGLVPAAGSGAPKLLEFDAMFPVSGPYVGAANPIRGINGGGLPWQIASAKGELTTGGRLEVDVEGLVLLDGPPVPEALQGTNPIPTFKAIVSCQSIGADGAATIVNVSTAPFPATASGDSEIEAQVGLPAPCVAPIVFVAHGGTGAWFAVTGM